VADTLGALRDLPKWLDPRVSPRPVYFVIGWMVLYIGASVLFRLTRHKPIFRPHVPDALFAERWASGRSLRNVLTRLGSASGCLWVAVTRRELLVGPHFPFTLMFLPEVYGLEYRIDVRDLVSVEERRTILGSRRVRIAARGADGGEESFDLQVRDTNGFLHAINQARGHTPE